MYCIIVMCVYVFSVYIVGKWISDRNDVGSGGGACSAGAGPVWGLCLCEGGGV